MFDTVAHVGMEHPDLLWIAGPTLLAFAVGFALAVVADTRRTNSQPEAVSEPEEQ
ncbi:hypothetical protein [Halovenus amylolytica]|uniref:hypothetical protein n=1 Tax=Halovenus amylolytica TaxID=2500550 RepID=UPI0036146CAB